MLTESLVLAAAGGAAGLVIANGLLYLVQGGIARLPFPLELDLSLDRRVIAYLLGLSTATAMFFGLLPARHAARADLVTSAGGTVLRSFLAGVGPTDPMALLAAVGIVSGSALTATFLPAWRATRLDPMATLRDT